MLLKKLRPWLGILISGLYALLLRFVFGTFGDSDPFDLFSITFVWIVPIIIGCIPFLFAPREKLRDLGYRITLPAMAVLFFLLLCFMTRLEDLICLLILAIPFCLAAIIGGLLIGWLIMRYKDKKGIVYSFVLLPFLVSPIEQQFKAPTRSYSVITKTIISATPEVVWQNIVRVSLISEQEYNKGFFNYAGIPRPLFAELDKDTLGATRTGHFEGGLLFTETVTAWERNKHIAFDISVIPSSIRQTVFDQHILKGDHFRFLNAGYSLRPLPGGQTELTLSSSYQLSTTINAYASFWGNLLLTDFQGRLLEVIKARCDH